ncbi:ABC transporter ATP-binding protein [Neptunicella sp. SCSIO 80796]|uniref:ABC transporter ATP-binding protein n=1 Tax=Neptunicella plasticusilytica TaxID=3117012 RepID=UPI003A4DF294
MSLLIECRNVSRRFGSKVALDNVSFEVNRGAPVALVGPNGAGKTTLFSLLCGYLSPSTGSIAILGHKPGSPALINQLSALPQDALLDPRFSIGHQLKFYARLQGLSSAEQQRETERCLELVSLSDSIDQLPAELSHGMRKRVSIAQALIGQPEIVMLDEATAGLDPKNARQIRELVADLAGEITFILSSHDLNELERLCGSVLFLEQGQLRQQNVVSHESVTNTLTLRMQAITDEFIPALEALPGMLNVQTRTRNEFVLLFDPQISADMHIQVLSLCYQRGWSYRQLIAGATLENMLFENA